MAVDSFLKLEGVKGESSDKEFAEEIDILAWSWGMSQSGSFHAGTGGGAGKVNVQDISITKYVDKASPILMQGCCKGTHFKKASIICRKAGDKPLKFMVIDLENVMVTNVSTGGSQGEERLTENVTLNFKKFTIKYTQQDEKGATKAAPEFVWDIAANA